MGVKEHTLMGADWPKRSSVNLNSIALPNYQKCLSGLKLNCTNWIWIFWMCKYMELNCQLNKIHFQSKLIQFHNITFSFKFIGIQIQIFKFNFKLCHSDFSMQLLKLNNTNSNHVIQIQFLVTHISAHMYPPLVWSWTIYRTQKTSWKMCSHI